MGLEVACSCIVDEKNAGFVCWAKVDRWWFWALSLALVVVENEGVSVNEVTLFAFNRNKADIARRNFMLKVAVVCSLGFLIFVCCCLFAGVLAKGWEIQGCVCLVGFV